MGGTTIELRARDGTPFELLNELFALVSRSRVPSSHNDLPTGTEACHGPPKALQRPCPWITNAAQK